MPKSKEEHHSGPNGLVPNSETGPLLRQRMAFLSGGRDRQGGAIITFPANFSSVRHKGDELRDLLTYLCGIPSEEVKRHGFTIIIDMRGSSWDSVKSLLRSVQEHFACKIRNAFVVQPDNVTLKPKSAFIFEWSLVYADQLPKYINTSQLTSDFGGSLWYDHDKWMEMKHKMDKFMSEASGTLDRLDQFKQDLVNAELAKDLTGAHIMLRDHDAICEKCDKFSMERLETDGHMILRDCHSEPYDSGYPMGGTSNASCHYLAQNPDFQAPFDRVRLLLDRLQNVRSQLRQALKQRQERLEQCRDLRAFQAQSEDMLKWINDSRRKFLVGYTDIGRSHALVKDLQQGHMQFQTHCMEAFLVIDRVLDLAGRLISIGHYAAQVVKADKNKLDQERKALDAGLKDRTVVLGFSATFHKKAEDFARDAPIWSAACEIEEMPAESGKIEMLKQQHEYLTKSIGQAYTEVHSSSKEVIHHLDRLISFCQRALGDYNYCYTDGRNLLDTMHGTIESVTGSVTSNADYTRGAKHVIDVLQNVFTHYQDLQQRCDFKKSVLEEHWTLQLFRDDVRQVIDWIQKWADPYLAKTCEIGHSLGKAKKLKEKHVEFEERAQNTYTNAAKLLDAADRLIAKGGCNIEEVKVTAAELDKITGEFGARATARRVMLDTAVGFYERLTKLTINVENAKNSLRNDPSLESVESVNDELSRLIKEQQAVMECCTHAEREGYVLLNQLRESSTVSTSADDCRVADTLRNITANREALEAAWLSRRLKLDIFWKLRLFQRAAEITVQIDMWLESIAQEDRLETDAEHAEMEYRSLDAHIKDYRSSVQDAIARGVELLEFLADIQTTDVDLNEISVGVNRSLEYLADFQSDLQTTSELYRLRLRNIIELHHCDLRGQEILVLIQARERTLKSIPVSLLTLAESEVLLKSIEQLQLELGPSAKMRIAVQDFQVVAEGIIQNDIDGAEVAQRLMNSVNSQWQQLLVHTDELYRAIASGVTFYRAAAQVCTVLSTLEKEYKSPEDWCNPEALQRNDNLARITKLMNRHQEQKDKFMKACTHVRRTAELFSKHFIRAAAHHPVSEKGIVRNVNDKIRADRERITRLEHGVLELWTHRKKHFDQFHQYIRVEQSIRQALAWIQDTGEAYLSTHKSLGNTQGATEALLNEHREFLSKARQNKEKIGIVMQLADGLENNGHDHASSIKAWVSKVDARQKDFMSRMEAYQRQLEDKLGVVINGRNSQSDRHSDGSLESKLLEMCPKEMSDERRKSAKHQEFMIKKIMTELLDTEKVYVTDLADCIKHFRKEMEHPTCGICPSSAFGSRIPEIFGNIEDIHEFHSKIFLNELEKYESMPEDVAHCFITWIPKFEMYVRYCINMEVATVVIAEPAAIDYFRELQSCFKLKLAIDAYLIKPVQRITKYAQLLEQLSKFCEDDRGEIRDGIEVMRNVPQKANDIMKLNLLDNLNESTEKFGELILTDSFHVWDLKQKQINFIRKGRDKQLFLFEFALLFTKKTRDANGAEKFVFKNKLMTAGLGISEHVEGDECKFLIWLGRTSQSAASSDSKIILKAPSLSAKQTWIQKLREVVQDNCVSTSLAISQNEARQGNNSHVSGSRGSKDYEDSLSIEEGCSGSHERFSTISHSSSNTTDSEKTLYEGDWAVITESYEAVHDGELTVQKGECVEVLDRSSSGDSYLVRVKATTSKPGNKTLAGLHQKVLEGFLPGAILSVIPNNRSTHHLSPSRALSMEGSHHHQHHDDGLGSGSTVSMSVPPAVSGGSSRNIPATTITGEVSPTKTAAPPTSKRRNTFRKWLTNPVRKLSQNRIDSGSSSAPPTKPPVILQQSTSSSLTVPVSGSGAGGKKNPTTIVTPSSASTSVTPSSSSYTSSASSRVKSLFQSQPSAHSSSSPAPPVLLPPEDRRASAPAPPLAQQEDLHEFDHHNLINKASVSAPVSKNVSLDVVVNDPADIINADITEDNNGAVPPEMPPPMEQIQSIPGLSATLSATAAAATLSAAATQEQQQQLLLSSLSLSSFSVLPTDKILTTTTPTANNTTVLLSIHPHGSQLAGESENLTRNCLPPPHQQQMSNHTTDSHSTAGSPAPPAAMEQVSSILPMPSNSSSANNAPLAEPASSDSSASFKVLELKENAAEGPNGSSDHPHEPGEESGAATEELSATTQPETATVEDTVVEVQDPVTRAVMMRDFVMRELVDTERDYVKDLGLIIDGYVTYMHENPMPEDMNGRDKLIFGNIQQIYVFHRDTFYGELEKCLDAADRLPQAFIRYERKFQMYVVYCQNKPKSEFIVSEYIDTYFEEIRLKLGHKLKLPDMLIKPVQRVMRYQLMLKDILKYTERAGNPGADLQKALNCIMGVCKLANDFMEVGRLQGFEGKLTAQGKLMLQGTFMVCETVSVPATQGKEKDKDKEKKEKNDAMQNNKFKERQIFVFEQVVIFSEVVGQNIKKVYSSPVYIYKSHIQVNKMSLIEVEKDLVRFALRSRCPHSGDMMFVIEAPDKEKRDYWVAQIKTMLDTQQNFLRALQSPIDYQRRTQAGDEVITILPGAEIPPPPPAPTAPPRAAKNSFRPPAAVRNPSTLQDFQAASTEKPFETRFSKFLRPKSYTEDRRRTVSVPHTPETPMVRSQPYGGSLTTPITPPAHDLVPLNATSGSSGLPIGGKFLFPIPGLKIVHSATETDLFRKAKADTSSSGQSERSKSPLLDLESQDVKSRRWSISGRRDKPPPAAAPAANAPAQSKERNGLSFRRKN